MAITRGTVRKRRERHDGWNADCRKAFLAALSVNGNVTYSARAVHKSRQTAYRLRLRDPAFAAAWDEAIEQTMDELFALLLHRAKHGNLRTFTDSDGKIRTVHSYSDNVGLRLLSHYRPTLHRTVVAAAAAAASSVGSVEIDVCREVSRIIHDRDG